MSEHRPLEFVDLSLTFVFLLFQNDELFLRDFAKDDLANKTRSAHTFADVKFMREHALESSGFY